VTHETPASRPRAAPRRAAVAIAALAVAVLGVYCSSPVIQSGDGRLVIYEADSVLHEQNLDLHEFGGIVQGFPCYREGNRILSRYPYGTSLVTAPILAVTIAGGRLVGADPTSTIRERYPRHLEKTLAGIIAALAVAALALLGLEVLGRTAPAVLLAAIFALGTSLWSTVSRGLWQHGPLILLFTAGLICLARGLRRDDWRWISAAGLPLAGAYVVRPTAAVPLALGALVLLATRRRRAFAGYAAAAACVLVPSVAYNLWVYDQVAIPFYTMGSGFLGSGLRSSFLTGLAGTMISPSRGLLVYSPFLALAAAGLWMRRGRLGALDVVAVGATLIIWILASNTQDWSGGWSYGPRLLADTLPFLAYLMLPVVDAVARPVRSWSRPVAGLAAALAICVGWSVFVNARGATSWATQLWNVRPEPAGVQNDPGRFWEWDDPPFLRTGQAGFKDIYPWSRPPKVEAGKVCVES